MSFACLLYAHVTLKIYLTIKCLLINNIFNDYISTNDRFTHKERILGVVKLNLKVNSSKTKYRKQFKVHTDLNNLIDHKLLFLQLDT